MPTPPCFGLMQSPPWYPSFSNVERWIMNFPLGRIPSSTPPYIHESSKTNNPLGLVKLMAHAVEPDLSPLIGGVVPHDPPTNSRCVHLSTQSGQHVSQEIPNH